MYAEMGGSDGAMHKFKSGTEIGYSDGANHKIKLIEVGGSDGANHVVWRAADCHAQITQASGNVTGPWDFHLNADGSGRLYVRDSQSSGNWPVTFTVRFIFDDPVTIQPGGQIIEFDNSKYTIIRQELLYPYTACDINGTRYDEGYPSTAPGSVHYPGTATAPLTFNTIDVSFTFTMTGNPTTLEIFDFTWSSGAWIIGGKALTSFDLS